MSLFLLVFLSACATPEEKAAEVALAYQSAGVDVARSYPLVCEKDKATKSLTDRTAELTAASAAAGVLGEAAGKLLEMAANSTYTVDSTIVTPDGGSATVTLVMTYEGEEVNRPTVELQATEDGWCVVTGWAEKKRIEEEKARVQAELVKVDEALAEALEAYEAWDFDETEALLKRGLELLDSLPEEHLGYSGEQVRKSITELQELLEERRSQHVAGRWLAKVTTDPMTDDTNVLAYMESLDGMPNAIGDLKKVTLIARCQEGDSVWDGTDYSDVFLLSRADADAQAEYVTITPADGERREDLDRRAPCLSRGQLRRLLRPDRLQGSTDQGDGCLRPVNTRENP